MNIKYVAVASVLAIVSISAVKAEDFLVIQKLAPAVMVFPDFSWSGLYFGVQSGNFASKHSVNLDISLLNYFIHKDSLPKFLGSVIGFYAGYNVHYREDFILSFDTDIVFSGAQNTKIIDSHTIYDVQVMKCKLQEAGINIVDSDIEPGDMAIGGITLKKDWAGAMRMRIGFIADRIISYIAGGAAYTQLRGTTTISIKEKDGKKVMDFGIFSDEIKIMVGYTFGAGIDFVMTQNLIARAEYRYSDFGRTKFVRDIYKISYQTNNLSIGLAYKF